MKILVLLFSLFFSIDALAQAVGINSPENSIQKADSVLFILDGLPVSRNEVKGANIIASQFLAGEKMASLYVNRRLDTIYVLVTEKYASLSYKHTFSGFSREYRNYLNTTSNSDDDVVYSLNKDQLDFLSSTEKIKKLYSISSGTIKEVRFYKNKISGISKPTVAIITR